MKILVIDGQGGKMGSFLVRGIKARCPEHDIFCIGTNSIATSAMLKAGGDHGATGENPVVRNAQDADVIVGPIGIIVADAILGEVTEKMAAAVGSSHAKKILVPMTSCSVLVAGTAPLPTADYIKEAVEMTVEIIESKSLNK